FSPMICPPFCIVVLTLSCGIYVTALGTPLAAINVTAHAAMARVTIAASFITPPYGKYSSYASRMVSRDCLALSSAACSPNRSACNAPSAATAAAVLAWCSESLRTELVPVESVPASVSTAMMPQRFRHPRGKSAGTRPVVVAAERIAGERRGDGAAEHARQQQRGARPAVAARGAPYLLNGFLYPFLQP